MCSAGLATKLSPADKTTVEEAVNDAVKWLEKNPEATVDEFKARKKELEETVQPIMSKLYQGAGEQGGPGGPGGPGGEYTSLPNGGPQGGEDEL